MNLDSYDGHAPRGEGDCLSYDAVMSSNRLTIHPCIKSLGHHGDCEDSEGHTWTRLEEDLRRRAEAAAGGDPGGY